MGVIRDDGVLLGQPRGEGTPGGRAALGECGVSAACPRGSPLSAPGGQTCLPPAPGPGSPAKRTVLARGTASKYWLAWTKQRTGGGGRMESANGWNFGGDP